uniref:Cuticlin-1 n=1 Tax=Zeugodacus cucurbitae TaxID=28588 RepID=A0A0A1X8W7_ZEUCU
MRHRQRSIHTHNAISHLLLLMLLIAAPIASSDARHSRTGLADNDKPAVEATGATPKAQLEEGRYDSRNSAAIVASEAQKTGSAPDATKEDSTAALENNEGKALSQKEVETKDAEQFQQENKELQIDIGDIGDEDIEFIDNAGEDSSDIGNDQDSNLQECDKELIGFEITTGYVFSAPGKLLTSMPGTLMLTDCLDACRKDAACHSANYETGLCVLFSANADKLPGALAKSQFPVFTLYAQKSCLSKRPCSRAWYIDRVQGLKLNGYVKRKFPAETRRDCIELCLAQTEFTCRSANFERITKTCELSEMDRMTLSGNSAFQQQATVDYLENNCADEPNKLCEFKRLPGRILKTVDSVYQDIGSFDECRDLCLNAPYRCHSYDYGDTGDMVCRLSHHSRITLNDVQDPYLDVPEATTYELSSCYNVTIECGAGDMIARIRTSKLFDGKVYAKGSPKSCAVDVKNSLEFELHMGYQNLECNVRQSNTGRYMNDVVIQHHDTIVTSSDLGLAVTCHYDLANKTVSNKVLLDIKDDFEPALSEEVIVDSPNVLMKITSRDGSDVMRTAEVGDPLALKFEILDAQSPYEIFVRELVAMDGSDNAEITLIDSHGCPTDQFIMGPIYKSSGSGKILLAHFDAFKFPTSELVQFRALVTPCMPSCEPVQCNQEDIGGEFKSMSSYGRRRRALNGTAFEGTVYTSHELQQQLLEEQQQQLINRQQRLRLRSKRAAVASTSTTTKQPSQEDLLLVQSIQITDKFGFDKQRQQKHTKANDDNEKTLIGGVVELGYCVNGIGLVLAVTVFLLAQLAIIAVWTYFRQRRRKPTGSERPSSSKAYTTRSGNTAKSATAMNKSSSSTRTESLCKVYDRAFDGRHGRQF